MPNWTDFGQDKMQICKELYTNILKYMKLEPRIQVYV